MGDKVKVDKFIKIGNIAKMNCVPSVYCKRAIDTLKDSTSFAEDYVRLKMEFFYEYQMNMVFPLLGVEFFEVVSYWLSRGDFMVAPKEFYNGKPIELSEYEKNFNAWLKTARTIK